MVQYFQKPENALKRANEFIDVGKQEAALDVLYDVIKSKKHRTWQKIHEPILQAYLTLCVNLKRSVNAKEGLYQYKLICQQVNILSLEEIISFFLNLAEKHADDARNQSIELVTVEDLDQVQTPEGILLSSVSSEDAQDRSDRVLLTPWVKFLWEAYRNVLELLRNNNRVEKLYHEVAQNAFKFCLKYARRAEFRKLCVLIKNHLDQVLKYQGQPTAIDLNNPESLQLHLETRLFQLENAITMELWQEAFRAIEGIHYLMQMSKKQPKPHMLANYYQKVALVFFKAENILFHSAALLKMFRLIKEQKKSVTQEELKKIGSQVLLAALSVPVPPGKSNMEEYLSYNTMGYEKDRRLATLLSLHAIPTRKSLLQDVEAVIFPHLPKDLQDLYLVLEHKFEPHKLCKKIDAVLKDTNKDENLVQYAQSIKDIAITRLLGQVSQIYEKLSFKQLLKMVPFADLHYLERMIVQSVKKNEMQISISHFNDSISFGSALVVALREEVPDGPHIQAMPSEILRSQLFSLSEGLKETVRMISPEITKKEQESIQESLASQYLRNERKEHATVLNRKSVIEQRKERIENERNALEKKEREQVNYRKEMLRQAEEQRLAVEREKRERERQEREIKEIKKKQVWDRVESLRGTDVGKRAFKNLSAQEIDEMNPDDILQRQYDQVNREKIDKQNKLRIQEKKIDHMVRALRLEEIPVLQKHIAASKVKDQADWEQSENERIKVAAKEHQLAIKTKARLARMDKDKQNFLDNLFGNRRTAYEEKLADFEDNLEKVRAERLEANRNKRVAQRRDEFIKARREEKRKEKLEQERREREGAEARRLKEAEEKKAAEEARKAALEESFRKQQERQREIDERLERESKEKEASAPTKYVPPSQRRRQQEAPPSQEGGARWRDSGREERQHDGGRWGSDSRGEERRDGGGAWRSGGFDRRDGPRDGGYENRDRRDDRGSFDRRDDRGGFDRRDDRGGFDRRDDRGGFDRRDDRGGFDRRDERHDDIGRGFGGSWRSNGEGGTRSEGRSYKASRADRDSEDRQTKEAEPGWNVVRK